MNSRNSKKVSVLASLSVFMIALLSFAVFTMVGNQDTVISHAIDATGVNFTGESFHFLEGNIVTTGNDVADGFNVPLYYANQINPKNSIYCVWHNVGVISSGDTSDPDFVERVPGGVYNYVRDGENDDYGLLYLLNVDIPTLTGVVSGHQAEVNSWIRQSAIWGYLHKTNNKLLTGPFYTNGIPTFAESLKVNELSSEELTLLSSSSKLTLISFGDSGDTKTVIYNGAALANSKLGDSGDNTVVGKLIRDAINYSNEVSESNGVLKVESTDVSLTEDEKYYQSQITITPIPTPYENDLINYYIMVTKIDGVEILNKDGVKLDLSETNVNGVDYYRIEAISGNSDRTVFVRVPAEKISDEVMDVQVMARGKIKVLNGHFYVDELYKDGKWDGKLQRVITVTGEEKDVKGSDTLVFHKAGDTGMNTTQTIYFVGLIVLLCGIGIVYANAKPIENKQ